MSESMIYKSRVVLIVFSLLLTQCVFRSDSSLDQTPQSGPSPITTTSEPVATLETIKSTMDLTTPTVAENMDEAPTQPVPTILAEETVPFESNDWQPTTIISPPAVPTNAPLPDLLTFIEEENAPIIVSGRVGSRGNDKLFLIGLDGEIKYTFEIPGKSLDDPTLSPDCSQIAFTAIGEDQDETTSDIMIIRNSDDMYALQTNLSIGNIANPSWSPDGNFLAFENHIDNSSQIMMLTLESQTLTQITLLDAYYYPTWSINNQIGLLKRDKDPSDAPFSPQDALYIASPEGNLEELLVLDNFGFSPDWSPDGQQLAFVSFDFPSIDIKVSRVILLSSIRDINETRALTANTYPDNLSLGTIYHERDPIWLPSGDQVMYVRDHSEDSEWVNEICLADVETGVSTCFPNPAEIAISSLDWCPTFYSDN